ncbi:MAG: pyridoxamine 5'-phosphate oxidase family protein [Thermodesulfobacteriota bacterium]
MTTLTDEARRKIREIHPALVATASTSGRPHVSAKGCLRVLDDDHVAFADVASPRTLTNIKENPQVAIMFLDVVTRRGCCLWGQAEVITSGELFESMAKELAERNMKVNHVVKVAVEDIETF